MISTWHLGNVFFKKFSHKPFNKWIIALVLTFLKAKDVLIILIFKQSVMQYAPYTSKRALIIGGKSYLANIQDRDGTLPRLLIHA